MDLSLNIDNIIEREITKVKIDKEIDCSENSSLRDSIADVVRSHFETNVIFNEITNKVHHLIENAIERNKLSSTENCMIMRSDDIKNLPALVSFFKENQKLDLVKLDYRWCVVSGVTLEQLYDAQEFNKSPINFITLNRDNLSKYRKLVIGKSFSYSKDKKFIQSGCHFKLTVRVGDNVSVSEIQTRTEHYQRVIARLADTLTENGYNPRVGMSGGYDGLGLTLYCNELPSLNILKLYRLNNVTISVPEDRRIVTNEEFENIFSYFI